MGQPAKRQSLPHSGSRRDRLRTNAVLHSSPIRSGSLYRPPCQAEVRKQKMPSARPPAIQLFVPDLLSAPPGYEDPADLHKHPALRRLMSRGIKTRTPSEHCCAQLCAAFGVQRQHDWPVAALTLMGDGGRPGADLWMRADPVHVRLNTARPAARGQWRHLAAGNSETTGNSEHSLCPRRSEVARPPSATLVCDWVGLDECRYDTNLCRARPPGRSASSTRTRCQAMAWSIQRNANAVA